MTILQKIISLFKKKKYNANVIRFDTLSDDENFDKEIKKVMNLLNYTKKNNVSYSASSFETGYHTFEIGKYKFNGQRIPKERFKNLPFSLKGMTVLDLGCNQGGMLHAFSKEIKFGVGIDYDSKMINAANKIKSYTQSNNLDFYNFNLDTEPLEYIQDFLPENKVDMVLFLSVCKWINKCKEVIQFSKKISSKLIFETNGSDEEQLNQINYLKNTYKNVQLINKTSTDDPLQKKRQLYLCY